MFEIITRWNLSRPDEEINDFIDDITLRGYKGEATFLTGEFKSKIFNGSIKPLPVGNIADKICPTRRDLYFIKGVNKVKVKDRKTWGRTTGKFVEDYFYNIFEKSNYNGQQTYSQLNGYGNKFNKKFFNNAKKKIVKLEKHEAISQGSKEGDTAWLLKLLSSSGRAELGFNILHSILKEDGCVDVNHVQIEQKINPDILQIGINSPTAPDFIIPDYKIVGDIKTAPVFNIKYQLTCAGYALAYENEKQQDINWGIIYFIPTRSPSAYARILTYPQIHIFPINNKLRQWFLDNRDEAYRIISKEEVPNFPKEDERKECLYCKFLEHCKNKGLTIDNGNE